MRSIRGDAIGTRFPALVTTLESRKRFILSGADGTGSVQIDAGAARALLSGSSLLPVGVTSVSGEFDRGDTISVLNTDGSELARGLTSYQASEMTKIAGRQSREIEPILGYAYGEEVIHRDQLVLLARQEDKPT
jgi:glutamate 5-kinase